MAWLRRGYRRASWPMDSEPVVLGAEPQRRFRGFALPATRIAMATACF